MTDVIATPDLAAIKQRQQATWASGDYHMIGTQILIVSELLIEALDVPSLSSVIQSGNRRPKRASRSNSRYQLEPAKDAPAATTA